MKRAHERWVLGLAFALATLPVGCASRRPTPYEPHAETARDPRRADRLNAEALTLFRSNPARAESLLRQALSADLFHAPAHNNLGVLFLQRGMLFEAAAEFEWARTLMPEHPDPRMNLALVLERAGRTDDALAAYSAILEARPEHLPTIQALARLQVRAGRTDERTPTLLRDVALRSPSDAWRQWARMRDQHAAPR